MINSTNKKRVELLVERSTKHGQAVRSGKSRTYMIWSSMVGRCTRPSDGSYKYYGAKGVTVCDRWRKFENFFEDMGEAPDDSHIHRLNGATIYSKETCQWMSEKEHIGLHNTERGWGARLTRTELIDRVAGLQDELVAEREKVHAIEAEEIRRIRHLNRLGSWAQQDPTGPTQAGRIQEWVLAELKAALGSEYKPTEWQPEFLKLKDQLAAERHRREQAERNLEHTEGMWEQLKKHRDELHEQLLSALAAIEHVRKREGCIVTDERLAQIIDNVELSALREHDAELIKKDRKSRPQPHFNAEVKAYVEKRIAEVRNPLVNALEQARALIGFLQSCVRSGEALTPKDGAYIRSVLDQADDALAKVK